MKIKCNIGALFFWGSLFLIGKPLFFAAVAAALFHELGHLLAARHLKIGIRCMELDLLGAKIYLKSALPSYRSEFILAAAGPLFSVLLALLLLPFASRFATTVRTASASFALFNLFPIAGFDGGRMLASLTAAKLGDHAAALVSSLGTYLSLLFFFCLSACLLLCYGQNIALLLLSASLFSRIFLPRERA